jgi:hypothetical protein
MGRWKQKLTLFLSLWTIASPAALRWCNLHLARLSEQLAREPKVQWPSAHLKPGPVTPERVREIAAQVYDPNSPLGRELDQIFSKKMENPDSLDDYFRSYEVFYWSPLYREIADRMHEALPASGRFLDLGSGTGGLGGILAQEAPGRLITFMDKPLAVDTARSRMTKLFPGAPDRFEYIPFYAGPKTRLFGNYDGALINHVLYTMPPKRKEGALAGLRDHIPAGGIVAINEPVKEAVAEGDRHREWMTRILETAVANGAPHSEYDVATILAFASGRATKSLRSGQDLELPLQTRAEQEALFERNGFEIVRSEPTYDGFSRFWVLRRKPN